MPTLLDDTLVIDSLNSLPGWEGDPDRIFREVSLTAEQDAELRRQIDVDAGAMGHLPEIETNDGSTRIVLRTPESGGVTELDIVLASHISDLIHRVCAEEPGVQAEREDESLVVIRPGGSASDQEDQLAGGEQAPTVGVPSVTGGTTPRVPLPDTAAHEPQPGASSEQEQP